MQGSIVMYYSIHLIVLFILQLWFSSAVPEWLWFWGASRLNAAFRRQARQRIRRHSFVPMYADEPPRSPLLPRSSHRPLSPRHPPSPRRPNSPRHLTPPPHSLSTGALRDILVWELVYVHVFCLVTFPIPFHCSVFIILCRSNLVAQGNWKLYLLLNTWILPVTKFSMHDLKSSIVQYNIDIVMLTVLVFFFY